MNPRQPTCGGKCRKVMTSFGRDALEKQRILVKTLLEEALERELAELLGAARYRRTEERHGYRNGFYHRDLATQMGSWRRSECHERVPYPWRRRCLAATGGGRPRSTGNDASCERIIYAVFSHLNRTWQGG